MNDHQFEQNAFDEISDNCDTNHRDAKIIKVDYLRSTDKKLVINQSPPHRLLMEMRFLGSDFRKIDQKQIMDRTNNQIVNFQL